MTFTPIVVAHVATATGALLFGGVTLALRKGTPLHRALGRTWVVLMLTTALISFGIRTSGTFSWIHVLSVITLASVATALIAALRGNIRLHRRTMLATYISLVITATFTLLPGRLLGKLIWNGVLV